VKARAMLDSDYDLNIDLHTLRIVRAIAASGSITGAARALGTTQPAISQHLQRAERRLSMALVVRQGRSIELTEIGLLLSRHAEEILRAVHAAGSDLAGAANLRSGRVRMAAFPSASSTLIPHLVSGMRERHPGITVRYTEGEPPESIAMVAAGECDVALIFTYPEDAAIVTESDPMKGLITTELFRDDLFALVSRDHPLAGEARLHLEDLEDDEWIAGCPRCSTHLVRACESVGYNPNIVYETDNSAATIGMVAQGLGIALVPRLALGTALLPPSVVVKKLAPEIARTISLVVPHDKQALPAVSALIAAIGGIDGANWRLRPAGMHT
jgi:DNA-binding transcriptional LysR family regulator